MKSLAGLVCGKPVTSLMGFTILCNKPPKHDGPCDGHWRGAAR